MSEPAGPRASFFRGGALIGAAAGMCAGSVIQYWFGLSWPIAASLLIGAAGVFYCERGERET